MRTGLRWGMTAAIVATMPTWAAVAEKPVSIKDPAALAATLREMGYVPGPLAKETKSPAFLVTLGGKPTRFTFGGCNNRVDCKYLYLSSAYRDIHNPPADWVNRMNDRFDIIKVSTDADRDLFFSATHVIEGAPRSTLKLILEMWVTDANALAQEAITAKLNSQD